MSFSREGKLKQLNLSKYFNLFCIWVSLIQWTSFNKFSIIIHSFKSRSLPAYTLLSLPLPHGCDISFPEAKAQGQKGINAQARATGIKAPEVMPFHNHFFWSLEPTATKVTFLSGDGRGAEPLRGGSLRTRGRFLIIPSPPRGSATAPRSFRAHGPRVVGRRPPAARKKQRSSSKSCKRGWQNKGVNSTLALRDLASLCPWTRTEPWINRYGSPDTNFGICRGPNWIATWGMFTYPDSIDKIIRI